MAWNTGIQVAGRLISLTVSMSLTAILTRHLGLASFGQLTAATTFIGIFIVLGDAGVYLVAVRRAAQEPERRAILLGNALGLRLLLALVPLAIGVLLVYLIPSGRFSTWVPAAKVAVAVLAINGYITLLNQFMTSVFRLHMRMDLAVLGEMLARLMAFGATLIVVRTGGGLIAAIVAMLVGTVTNFLYAWGVGRRFETFQPRLDPPIFTAMLREAAVLGIVTLLGLIHFRVDTFLLSLLRTAEEVGIYGVAYKVHEVLITFPGLFVGLLFPVFSRLVSEDPARLRQIFQRAFEVLVITGVGAALAVFVLAPDLGPLLGADAAVRPMRILALALPPVFVSLGFTHLLLAEARQRWMVPLYGLLVVVNLGLNIIVIRQWSYVGAAAVTVVSESLSLACLSVYWLGRRRWRLGLRVLGALPLAIGIAFVAGRLLPVAGEISIVMRILRLAVAGTLTLAAYAGGAMLLRLVPLAALRALLRTGNANPAATPPL